MADVQDASVNQSGATADTPAAFAVGDHSLDRFIELCRLNGFDVKVTHVCKAEDDGEAYELTVFRVHEGSSVTTKISATLSFRNPVEEAELRNAMDFVLSVTDGVGNGNEAESDPGASVDSGTAS